MQQTKTLRKMASTMGGMRRILKTRPQPVDYLRYAVQCGIYQDPDAPSAPSYQQGGRSPNGDSDIMNHPTSYEILTLNPPIPEPPRVTLKEIRRRERSRALPTDKLVKSYMRRYDARMKASSPLTDAQKEEQYYNKILGFINPMEDTNLGTAMGRKSSALNHAYEFAMKQYNVLQDNKGISEKESIQIVEDLLAKEETNETIQTRKNSQDIRKWRHRKEEVKAPELETGTDIKDTSEPTPPSSTIPSILHSKPRTITAMNIWGQRLAAVPYHQWNVGAATALDHWIACDVLEMSEETWSNLLNGELESEVGNAGGVIQVGNFAKGKDIVQVRGNLFPETMIGNDITANDDEMDSDLTLHDAHDLLDDSTLGKDNIEDVTERSIDELLRTLESLDEENVPEEEDQSSSPDVALEGDNFDSQVSTMTESLQKWRLKNQEILFLEWKSDEKKEFNQWLASYVNLLRTESDGKVDLVATREALLAEPPRSSVESKSFWSRISDEAEAEILLQDILSNFKLDSKEGENVVNFQSREAFESFLAIPYKMQLQKLISLGTLRPVLDEYAKESDRASFIQKYGEILLEGIEIEHLVPDPEGPISINELGDKLIIRKEDMEKGDRFAIKMIPYGSDDFGTSRSERARALYRAWNIQKAGRANYEEHLFKTRKIGLSSK